MSLIGRIIKPQVLDFEKAWDKEYHFKDAELDRTRKAFEKEKRNNPTAITVNARDLGTLVINKRLQGETRKKEPASIKFIKGEI